jgi:hypothetical protein
MTNVDGHRLVVGEQLEKHEHTSMPSARQPELNNAQQCNTKLRLRETPLLGI